MGARRNTDAMMLKIKVAFTASREDVLLEACFLKHCGFKLTKAGIERRLRNRYLNFGISRIEYGFTPSQEIVLESKKFIKENYYGS